MSSHVVGTPLLFLIAIVLIVPPPVATADSSKYQVECTMCAACDNPCPQYLSPPPPPPSQPSTYPYYSPPPPPYGSGGVYYPPPTPYPPSTGGGGGYLTPPPPNPILPYFPFYFYNPTPASSATTPHASLHRPTACAVIILLLLNWGRVAAEA